MRRVLGDVTTGFPKGAMHTHENVLATIETAFRVVRMPPDIGSELRALVVVPLVHVIGCHSQTLPALRTGGTAVTDASFDGRRMIEILRRERITSGTAVPAIYYHILNQPRFAPANVAAVHWACYGGAPIAPRSCAGSLSSSRTHLSATTRADQIDVDLDPAAARMDR